MLGAGRAGAYDLAPERRAGARHRQLEEVPVVDVLQVWMLIGVPALALSAALLLRRSSWRSLLGYAILFAAFGGMAVYHRPSAAVFGALAALVYASGRGGPIEREATRQDEEGVPDAALLPSRRTADA